MRSSRNRRARALVFCVAVLSAYLAASPALIRAAYPGRNGKLIFEPFNGSAGEGNPDNGLWTVDPNGNDLRRLAGIARDAGHPAFSPSGRQFAYVYGSPPSQVYIADSDGRRARQLSHLRGLGADTNKPSWSPDGRQLVFSYSPAHNQLASWIAVIRADGQGFHTIYRGRGDAYSPVWSSANRIAFVAGTSIWAIDPGGGHLRRLTHPTGLLADDHPNWSPDGRRLGFDRTDATDPNNTIANVYEIGAGGGRPNRLTGPGGYHAEPTFSPDGKQIVYVSDQGPAHANQLWAMRADGSAARQITRVTSAPTFPDWQPVH